ncbi:ATPase, vacuolar ER assembly factor, Vma12 [Rhodotorula toruloides]|uniref:ATPase, vacuolar ER assembly factor, Vma12 n=1 Tax=Rhodotorula toruloides TaxID=5286 RepID=A0A511KEF3_RHOTO|nr:ATPase, vacuolar ER assembly factor, Vma12 [Rhodotorula toruloides]
MVLLQLTRALRERLDALAPRLPEELREQVAALFVDQEVVLATGGKEETEGAAFEADEGLGQHVIPHEVLAQTSRWARGREDLEDPDSYRLASLLRLTDVHAPPLPPREKSPKLLAILADIQLQQDRRSYASLISLAPAPHPSLIPLDDPFSSKSPRTPAEEWKEIRREVSAIANVGASMLAVGTGVWWVGGGRSYAARLCLALSGALAIAAIEGWLYWRFFSRLDSTSKTKASTSKAAIRGGGARGGLLRNGVSRAKKQ